MKSDNNLSYLHLHEEGDRQLYIRKDQIRWFRRRINGDTNIQLLDAYTTIVAETPEEIMNMGEYGVIEKEDVLLTEEEENGKD